MRKVGARMRMGEVFCAVSVWKENWQVSMGKERAEKIMKRVGSRMLKSDLLEVVLGWRQNQMVASLLSKGEAILRRVGGRWKNRELAGVLAEWMRNFKGEELCALKARCDELESRCAELQLQRLNDSAEMAMRNKAR